MATIPKLTRPQIARIVNGDEVAIRFFEALINQSLDASPDALALLREDVDDAGVSASNAIGAVQSLADSFNRLADAVQSLSLAPTPHRIDTVEDAPARIDSLEARVNSLASDIDGLKQGLTS